MVYDMGWVSVKDTTVTNQRQRATTKGCVCAPWNSKFNQTKKKAITPGQGIHFSPSPSLLLSISLFSALLSHSLSLHYHFRPLHFIPIASHFTTLSFPSKN